MKNRNKANQASGKLTVIFNYPAGKKETYEISAEPGLYTIPRSSRIGDVSYINHDGKVFVYSISNIKPGDYALEKERTKPIVNNCCVVR